MEIRQDGDDQQIVVVGDRGVLRVTLSDIVELHARGVRIRFSRSEREVLYDILENQE